MNNFDKAIEIVTHNLKSELVPMGYDWNEIRSWNELLRLLDSDNDSLRNTVRFDLAFAARMGELGYGFPIDDETIDSVISTVRKDLFD